MSVESSLRELLREELDRARRELTAEVRTEIHQAIAAMRQPEPTAELLSVTAAAELMGVQAATIRRWICDGRLRGYGTKRALRVCHDELLDLSPDDDRPDAEIINLDERAAAILRRRR